MRTCEEVSATKKAEPERSRTHVRGGIFKRSRQMNWPGVCYINSSSLHASSFVAFLHFLFAFAMSRNVPFNPSHFFFFFFAVQGSLEGLPTFFFRCHCFADLRRSSNRLGVCGLGEPRQSPEPAEA